MTRAEHELWHRPLLTSTPTIGRLSFDRFNVHRHPTHWVFSSTKLELMIRWSRACYLDNHHHSIGDEPLNLEPRASEEKNTGVGTLLSRNFHTTPKVGRLSLNVHLPLLQSGSSAVQGSNA
ncbi:hypothetical protein TNCV_1193471 [Trichonephila clavipes]|nr:hypothetical protein TNCV_1193471 [Trichonephila clavipes]